MTLLELLDRLEHVVELDELEIRFRDDTGVLVEVRGRTRTQLLESKFELG